MLDPASVPPVYRDEFLARFLIFSGHIRNSNNTVKPDAFIPHPRVELSVTRHRDATEDELWREGERVAALRQRALYGRADVQTTAFVAQDLKVEARPLQGNPNHADVINWPPDKPAQKMKATEIALKSRLVSKPL